MEQPHQDQSKDFMPSYFPIDNDSQQRNNSSNSMEVLPSMYSSNPMLLQTNQQSQQSLASSQQVNIEMLNLMASMQAMDSSLALPSQSQAQTQQQQQQQPPSLNPQLLLEQQFKFNQLRQLQQLQQQIFQQQLAIIGSSQNPAMPENQLERGASYHGLPTPATSTELRPQHTSEFVSPMSLQYMNMDIPQDQSQYRAQMLENHGMASQSNTPLINGSRSQPQYSPRGTASAPAHVAFRSSPEYLPSPAELDFDISPLTSPWLGAHQQSSIVDPHVASGSTSQKRTASPNSADHLARKKQSPAIRPTNPGAPTTKKNQNTSRGGSKSVNSTPLLRSTRTRKGSTAGDLVGDTPSPVDLSMPPPASTVSSSNNVPPSTITSAQLTPVTPASIMKLGRLGVDSSLAPKPSAPKVQKKSSSTVQASPGLKAILPAGSTSSTASHSQPQQPVIHVRKTSHKAAEQKRRDSLKTTFDELRGLLPPIPLPNDEKYPDEPILPGALPPRGPPKAGSDGPNKGVSKLQLLICGNDYIRQLKGRVERRDDEIEKLRKEVKRLRLHLSDAAIAEGEEELDLELDLDAAETLVIGRGKSLLTDEDGEEEMEET